MTPQDANKQLADLQKLAQELQYTIPNDWLSNPLTNADKITAAFVKWDDELKEIKTDIGGLSSILKANLQELTKSNIELNIARKSSRDLVSISQKLLADRNGILDLDRKQIKQLQEKTKISQLTLSQSIEEYKQKVLSGDASQEELDSIRANYEASQKLLEMTQKRLELEEKVIKSMGMAPAIADGINKSLNKLGFGGLANQLKLDEAISKTRDFAKTNNGNVSAFKTLGVFTKEVGSNIGGMLTKANLLQASIGFLIEAVGSLDNLAGQTAKQFGTSYEEALKINSELVQTAALSDDIFVTTKALVEANNNLNAVLGTNRSINAESLITYTQLTKEAGYSVEAATTLYKLRQASGKTEKSLVYTYLGQVEALNAQNKLSINGKDLLNDISNVSKGILATYSKQPQKIAEAAFEAKKLGASLKEIEGIQNSLLDIESSISNEFEAEVMTGRALNLERARYFALTNDIAGVSKEINKQGIDLNKWSGMNILQQESIAKAMGMSKDQMAGMLLESKAISKLGMVDNEENRKKIQYLKEHGYNLSSIAELGKDELEKQQKSITMQDKFNQSIEKLKELFVELIDPLMPLLDVFSSIFTFVGKIMKALNPLIATLGVIISAASDLTALILNLDNDTGNPFQNTMNSFDKQKLSLKENWGVEDGMAPSSKGPFTVTDKYGATAVTAEGDHIVVSPNVTQSDKPISNNSKIITNNISSNEGGITILASTLSNKMDQMINKLDNVVMAINRGMVVNLDGNRVSQELGTPLAITTRRI